MPEVKNFETYPGLGDLLPNRGLPGVEYAIVHANHVPEAEEDRWEATTGVRSFRVNGVPCLLLSRNEPLEGAGSRDMLPSLSVDMGLDKLTGLGPVEETKDGGSRDAGSQEEEPEAEKGKENPLEGLEPQRAD